jgi:uncharacterized RDD family membrane protein YckC
MDDPGTPFQSGPSGQVPPPHPGQVIDPRSGVPYADYATRVGAWLLDAVIVLVGFVVVGIAAAIADGLGIIAFLALIAGSAAMLIMGDGGALGQTPGKHLTGIKVIGAQPGPIGYRQGAIRYLGRILDSIVCGIPIGLVWPLFDAERRAWHDIVADTRVVIAPPGERSLSIWWRNFRLQQPAGS